MHSLDVYCSFDLGPVHIVAFSTEYYFFSEFYNHSDALDRQYQWLQADLKVPGDLEEIQQLTQRQLQTANANRENVPWIITIGHRPMYCSNINHFDCTRYQSRVPHRFSPLCSVAHMNVGWPGPDGIAGASSVGGTVLPVRGGCVAVGSRA